MRGFSSPLLACLLLLTGCQSMTQSPDDVSQTQASAVQATPQTPLPPIQGLDAEGVTALLSAEIAGQRDQVDYALRVYLEQAIRLQEPSLARRATYIAQYAGDNDSAVEAAAFWSESAPDNLEAHRINSTLLVQQGDLLAAFEHQKRLLELGEKTHFSYLASQSERKAPAIREELLINLQSLRPEFPQQADLLTAIAQLLTFKGEYIDALKAVDQALAIKADDISAILLKSGLTGQVSTVSDGLKVLRQGIKQYPNNLRLQLALARALLKDGQIEEAKEVFSQISDKHPENGQLTLSLALILMESGLLEQAKQELEKLLANQQETHSAHYYLGRLAEQQQDIEGAIFHYQEVEGGKDFLQAHARAARIQIQRGKIDDARVHLARIRLNHPEQRVKLYLIESELLQGVHETDQAYGVLTEAVNTLGNDYELLYARAMLALQLKDLVSMEADLRLILETEPNNAMVLNTLGYTLAEYTDRYSEALLLVRKAYALKPGDPAITDSLGWAYFKLGQLNEAILFLQQAYDEMQDAEIASHLLETYWVAGHKEEAIALLQEAVQLFPEHELIEQVLLRFPELKNALDNDYPFDNKINSNTDKETDA